MREPWLPLVLSNALCKIPMHSAGRTELAIPVVSRSGRVPFRPFREAPGSGAFMETVQGLFLFGWPSRDRPLISNDAGGHGRSDNRLSVPHAECRHPWALFLCWTQDTGDPALENCSQVHAWAGKSSLVLEAAMTDN